MLTRMQFLTIFPVVWFLTRFCVNCIDISRDPNDIHFLLYSTKTDPSKYQEIIFMNPASLEQSGFQKGQGTVFIIHGFRTNSSSEFSQTVKNAYLESPFGFNYIVVEWGRLSTPLPPELTDAFYFLAVENVPTVAQRVGEFMAWIRTEKFLPDFSKTHLVGLSLGAHVSGLAARQLYKQFGDKVHRVTGLDPAGPLFYLPSDRKLNKGDASFMDIIHTNMGNLGDKSQDGDADFYPNGGVIQPDCKLNDTGLPPDTKFGSCSHRFSYKLYVASFKKAFIACKCDPFVNPWVLQACFTECPNPVIMGVHCPESASGQYYLTTTNPP